MSTYIYARVSTFDQYVNGNSIDAQCEMCLKHSVNHGMEMGTDSNCDLPGVFLDGGKSAYTKKLAERPGGLRLLTVLQPGDVVIATATHRLFRRMGDMVATMDHWVQNKISVRFTDYPMLNTDTANGKAMLYIFAVIAQMKSELTSSRVKEARAMSREKPKVPVRVQPSVPLDTAEHLMTKDVGSIMQEMRREETQSQFKGTVRAYIRVSTKEQTVEQQRQCIERMMPDDLRGAPTEWYSDEGVSAFKTKMVKRPSGSKLLEDLEPGDIVVTWRPDRMFRSLLDMANTTELIHRKGAFLLTVEGGIRTDSPFGKTMVSLLSLLAEVESQEISRSTKQGFFVAVGVSAKARAVFMPKFLSSMKDHHTQKHFCFNRFFTQEDKFNMHVQLSLTGKHYCSLSSACRVISNKWLRRKGLPSMTGVESESVGSYLAKVREMQQQRFSERREALIRVLRRRKGSDRVVYPINVTSSRRVIPNQDRFLRASRRISGRIKNKQALIAIAIRGSDLESNLDLIRRVS